MEHDAVQECAVVESQTMIGAKLCRRRGSAIDSIELRNFVGDRLAHYKRPQNTHRVDSLPRNALGKVQKHR